MRHVHVRYRPRLVGGRIWGRCSCGILLKLARRRWWEHGECGYLPKCRNCKKRGPLVRYRLRRWGTKPRGWLNGRICYLCWQVPEVQRKEKTHYYNRRINNVRKLRWKTEGRCFQCAQPRGEDGTRKHCRRCADKDSEYRRRYKLRAKQRNCDLGLSQGASGA